MVGKLKHFKQFYFAWVPRVLWNCETQNMLYELLVLGALAFWLFYRWATANNNFFKERDIPYHKPFPLLGSVKDMVLRKKSFMDNIISLYRMHDGKVFGVFDQRQPVFLIRDPELIKQITIKDFDHFINHRLVFGLDDTLFGSSLFFMQDGKWRDMRNTLSPAFTGSKMRQMFELINEVAEDSNKYLSKQINAQSKDGLELDLKDFATHFTNDVIASTAFGLKVNSFQFPNNEFYEKGKKATSFSSWQNTKFFLFANFRYIVNLFKLDLFDKEFSDYFYHLVLDAMKYRKEHNIVRPDMINLLMEARGLIESDHPKTHNREWTDTEIVAQCFVFFFAGFESGSLFVSFIAHELMENPDVQQKLFNEIEKVSSELGGKTLTYEALQSLKYMDMVVSEALRKWPAAVAVDRACNADYVFEADGKRIEIKKGDCIWLPIAGFHRDAKYFPNPDKFDPERFSDENKDKIISGTYFPFGLGPRNCIGSRFALMETKALVFYLLRDFRIEAGKKTSIPIELASSAFQMKPKKGFWLKLTQRK